MSDHNPLATVAHGHTLAEAIVDTLREPLVVLDRDLCVIAASRSFYRTFAVEPRNTQGRKLYLLGDGQWNIPALRTVLEEVIPKHRTVEAYEVEHEFPTIGRRVMLLNARQVFDEDGSTSALLLAIEDITQRRDMSGKKTSCCDRKKFCCKRCSIASPTAFRSSQAFFCSRREPCNPKRFACTCTMPTSGSCRWRRCNSNCRPRD